MTTDTVTTTLTTFERDVLDYLLLEGDVCYHNSGEWTMCELFGLPNSDARNLHLALRYLVKIGLVIRLDGKRNAMRSPKRLHITHNADTISYRAVCQ